MGSRLLPKARRWTWVSATAWTLTMPVIFLGASRPEASWSLPSLLLTGALTGALAGTTYGVCTPLREVLPGHHDRKTWWRNLDDRPDVELDPRLTRRV